MKVSEIITAILEDDQWFDSFKYQEFGRSYPHSVLLNAETLTMNDLVAIAEAVIDSIAKEESMTESKEWKQKELHRFLEGKSNGSFFSSDHEIIGEASPEKIVKLLKKFLEVAPDEMSGFIGNFYERKRSEPSLINISKVEEMFKEIGFDLEKFLADLPIDQQISFYAHSQGIGREFIAKNLANIPNAFKAVYVAAAARGIGSFSKIITALNDFPQIQKSVDLLSDNEIKKIFLYEGFSIIGSSVTYTELPILIGSDQLKVCESFLFAHKSSNPDFECALDFDVLITDGGHDDENEEIEVKLKTYGDALLLALLRPGVFSISEQGLEVLFQNDRFVNLLKNELRKLDIEFLTILFREYSSYEKSETYKFPIAEEISKIIAERKDEITVQHFPRLLKCAGRFNSAFNEMFVVLAAKPENHDLIKEEIFRLFGLFLEVEIRDEIKYRGFADFVVRVAAIDDEVRKYAEKIALRYLNDLNESNDLDRLRDLRYLNKSNGLDRLRKDFETLSPLIDRSEFLQSLNGLSSFVIVDSLQGEELELAREKVRAFSESVFVGEMFCNFLEQKIEPSELVKKIILLRGAIRVSYSDPYMDQIISIFEESLNSEERTVFITELLAMNSDNSAIADVVLNEVINLEFGSQKVKLEKVKDVVFLLNFYPDLITDEVVRKLARNARVINTINLTINNHNSPYFNSQSYNLFCKINEEIAQLAAEGEENLAKIALDKLRSFQELINIKASFVREQKETNPEIANSKIYELILEEYLSFAKFYEELSDIERKELGLFVLPEGALSEIKKWMRENLENLEKNFRGMVEVPKKELNDNAKRVYESKRRTLGYLIEEAKEILEEKIESSGREDSLLSCFKSIFFVQNVAEQNAQDPFIQAIASNIDQVTSANLIKENWSKFTRNIDSFLELGNLCETLEEYHGIISASLALITQPNCFANIAIAIQKELECRRYKDPKQAAFAIAEFEFALAFLNSAAEVIGSNDDYEEVMLEPDKMIYLGENALCFEIGKILKGLQEKSAQFDAAEAGDFFDDKEIIELGKMVIEALDAVPRPHLNPEFGGPLEGNEQTEEQINGRN